MNISDITKLAGRRPARKRLGRGRGSGLGKTSGRGHKGAGSRSGWRKRALKEGGQLPVFVRWPKRGFSNARFTIRYHVVNVASLEEAFAAGSHVTPEALRKAGLIRNLRQPVKILGYGKLTRKLTVEAARFSESARKLIEDAGGQARVIGAPAETAPETART